MRTASVAIALLLIAAPRPAAAAQPAGTGAGAGERSPATLPSTEPIRFELPNGLRVWFQQDRRRPIVHVRTVYKVGSHNEGPGTTGLAHYVEHMVYRATENISNEDIFGIIDRIGGRWTGGTSSTATSYGETVPAWALEDALRITAERMARTLFDEVEFERERSNVVTEANGFARTDPVSTVRDAVLAASFEIHPYRYSSNTWYRDNLTVTHAEAYDFYRQHYGPNNAVLAIVGDVDGAEVRRLVERHFGDLAPAPRTGEVRVLEPPQRVEKRVAFTHPDVAPRVEIVFRAPQATHPDYPVLVVFDRVLARRLAAVESVEVTTSHQARPQPYLYRLVASPQTTHDGERLIDRIQSEIDAIARDGVAAAELALATAPQDEPARRSGPSGAAPTAASLARIATELTSREVFPWELPAATPAAVRAAAEGVTSGDLQMYARSWLARSQRTVGVLIPADDEPIARGTDLRTASDGRMEIPPLTIPPAPRQRPLPVPPRALEPLAELPLTPLRRVLANGVVLRAVDSADTLAALSVRIVVPTAPMSAHEAAAALLAARAFAAALEQRVELAGAEVSSIETLATDAHVDVRLRVVRARLEAAIDALARALADPGFAAHALAGQRAALQRELAEAAAAASSAADAVARSLVLQRVAANGGSLDARAVDDALQTLDVGDAVGFLMQQLDRRAVVIAIGASSAANVFEHAADAFEALRPRRDVLADTRDAAAAAPPSGAAPPAGENASATLDVERVQRISLADELQVSFAAALPGVARDHADYWPLQLLNYIVGMPYYGGRLGWALTKGGLTYSSAATTTAGAATGHVLFTTRSNPANREATLQALAEVIGQVGDEGIFEWELREAQGFTLGRLLLNGPREDSEAGALAAALLDSESFGWELLDLPALSRSILAVSQADLDRVARQYYRLDRMHIALTGNLDAGPRASPFPAGTFRSLFAELAGRAGVP